MPTTPNALQRERIDELTRQGSRAYPSGFNGKSVITAFERYLTSGRASHITKALYDYLCMHAGYIAHYNLHTFRDLYQDPADLLNATHDPMRGLGPEPGRGSVKVYRDGMTNLEVWDRLAELIAKHRDTVFERSRRRSAEVEIAQVHDLAARHGLQLTTTATAAVDRAA
jgi:hypothetical protein